MTLHVQPPLAQTLLLFTGIPFAGKTTYATMLASQLKATILSIDGLAAERGVGLSGEHVRQFVFDQLHEIADAQTREALARGETVIYDSTLLRRTRETLRRTAHAAGVRAVIVFVDVPEHIAYARWWDNLRTKQRPTIHPQGFREYVKNFEAPTDAEGPLVAFGDRETINSMLTALYRITTRPSNTAQGTGSAATVFSRYL